MLKILGPIIKDSLLIWRKYFYWIELIYPQTRIFQPERENPSASLNPYNISSILKICDDSALLNQTVFWTLYIVKY